MATWFLRWRDSLGGRVERAAALALISGLLGCGAGPSAPAAPAPTLDGVAILGDPFMFIGASQTLRANAVFSDGSTAPITDGAWSSDTPSVATIGPTGLVRAVAPGRATIFLDYRGKQGWMPVRAVPDYRGTWAGTYFVQICSGTGSLHDITCRTLYPMGVPLPISLGLVQDHFVVSGTLALGSAEGTLRGFLHTDGQLSIASGEAWAPGIVNTLAGWSTLAVGDRMDGTFSFTVTMGTTPGAAWVQGSLHSMARVPTAAPAGSPR